MQKRILIFAENDIFHILNTNRTLYHVKKYSWDSLKGILNYIKLNKSRKNVFAAEL